MRKAGIAKGFDLIGIRVDKEWVSIICRNLCEICLAQSKAEKEKNKENIKIAGLRKHKPLSLRYTYLRFPAYKIGFCLSPTHEKKKEN